jgi:hypothetical protein
MVSRPGAIGAFCRSLCGALDFFFDGAQQILWHSVVSMLLGAIPLGLATIINGLLVFDLPLWEASSLFAAPPFGS